MQIKKITLLMLLASTTAYLHPMALVSKLSHRKPDDCSKRHKELAQYYSVKRREAVLKNLPTGTIQFCLTDRTQQTKGICFQALLTDTIEYIQNAVRLKFLYEHNKKIEHGHKVYVRFSGTGDFEGDKYRLFQSKKTKLKNIPELAKRSSCFHILTKKPKE